MESEDRSLGILLAPYNCETVGCKMCSSKS